MVPVVRDTPDPHVARLTLDRPERRNAIDREPRRALIEGVAVMVTALEMEPMAQTLCFLSPGAAEGRAASLEKRPPRF